MNIEETTSASGAAHRAQEYVGDLRGTAGDELNAAGHGTAAANAAASVGTTAHVAAESIGNGSDSVASKLVSSAAVRSHDIKGILKIIGRHPTPFVIMAAGLGFLAGSEFRRIKPHK